jgi:FkbM family methyltransferase
MITSIAKIVQIITNRDLTIVRRSSLAKLNLAFRWYGLKEIIANLDDTEVIEFLSLLDSSKSQFLQDLFVLSILGVKKDGYFVEFGATDGESFSNTHMLEKKLGWNGIVCEPSRQYHEAIEACRAVAKDYRCVTDESGKEIKFIEFVGSGLSNAFSANTFWGKISGLFNGHPGHTYSVETVSLTDLLESHGAPKRLDYLSIDVEGSEYSILKAFDWDIYTFSVITVEHNFSKQRARIYDLLVSKGYVRVLEDISFVDDWYVLGSIDRQPRI